MVINLNHIVAIHEIGSLPSQIASLAKWLVAMHSDSVVDNVMVGCFLHFHEMTPTPIKYTYPVVDR